MTTTFSNKCEILADFYLYQSETFPDIISEYDLGFPLAVAYSQGGIESLTTHGITWVNETFDAVCELYEIDKYGEYESLEDMFDVAAG